MRLYTEATGGGFGIVLPLVRRSVFWLLCGALACELVVLALGGLASAQTDPNHPPYEGLHPYVDPDNCTLPTEDAVNAWFVHGKVKKDGAVKPFESTEFRPDDVDCGFFAWAAQMFLWATSPMGSDRVFDSRGFFEVSPPDAQKQRVFLNPDGRPLGPGNPQPVRLVPFATRGPAGTPVALDKGGNLIRLDQPQIDCGPPLRVRDLARNFVPIERTEWNAEGHQSFFRHARDQKEIKTGVGQALCDDVLMAQNGSLIYYRVHVNAGFAFFLTGQKKSTPPKIQQYRFPSDVAELADVTEFVDKFDPQHHYPELRFPEKCALALEIKTSWIEVVPGFDHTKYITAEALVPSYRKGRRTWALRPGNRSVTLALVGMHIAGSAYDRRTMIWATFEHIGNAPNDGYAYNTAPAPAPGSPVPQPAPHTWLLWKDGGAENVPRMHLDDKGNIVAYDGNTIGPVNTRRKNAWGSASADSTAAQRNAEVIAVNQSVLRLLREAGDVRGNYMLIGATWTDSDEMPSGDNENGTYQLANATMETFLQGNNNCLGCHRRPQMQPNEGRLAGLSHIYGKPTSGLQPLPPPSPKKSLPNSPVQGQDCKNP
jgi:hypothetical protein